MYFTFFGKKKHSLKVVTTAVQQDKTVKLCLVGMSNEGSVGTEPSFECTNEKPFLYPTNSMVLWSLCLAVTLQMIL